MKTLLLVLTISCLSSLSRAQSLDLIYKNNKAVRTFGVEKKMEAYEQFLESLILDPYEPTVQFNVGSSLQALGEAEKAEKLYKQLLKDVNTHLEKGLSQDEQQKWLKVKFALLYNLGVHYQGTQKIDEALESYQQALELIPDSKEIKTNIEMMFNSGGGGKGEGKDKNKDQQQDGKGQQDQQDQGEGDKQKDQQPSDGDRTNKPQKGKGFDQSQLSMEDLNRIMDELKQQEQGVRAKVQRKGDKSEPKEKQW